MQYALYVPDYDGQTLALVGYYPTRREAEEEAEIEFGLVAGSYEVRSPADEALAGQESL